jgi:hypothetical protein
VTGTIGGRSLTPKDGIAWVTKAYASNINQYRTELNIVLTEAAGQCALASAREKRGGALLSLHLGLRKSDGYPSIAPGTYVSTVDVSTGDQIEVLGGFDVFDMACTSVLPAAALGKGTLVIDRVTDDGATAGAFDLTFGGDHVEGTFIVPGCAAAAETGERKCVP